MDGPAPTFAIYPLLTKSVKVLSTVTLLISGQSSMISFLVIFPTLLSIIALILSGLEILRCFRYKCLQFGFISVILAFDDGDFNRYDGDRIPHNAWKTISISFGFLRGADIISEGCIR